jgi:hypothetical protein
MKMGRKRRHWIKGRNVRNKIKGIIGRNELKGRNGRNVGTEINSYSISIVNGNSIRNW